MRNKSLFIVLTSIFGVSALLVFKNFFLPGPLAAGDAPFFVHSALADLIKEPQAWTYRGINFGGLNQFVWISPLMTLYGLLGSVLGNDGAIRLLFYFPSLICAVAGVYLLTKRYKLKPISQIFAIALYILNTYYILIIDGGQVGIALAYGLFPIAVYCTVRFLEKHTLLNFMTVLLSSSLLTLADPRIFMIQVLFIVGLSLLENTWRQLRFLVLVLIPIALINLYWLLPLFVNGSQILGTEVSQLQLTSLLNGLLLYQPHWYENIYGKISYPEYYFVLFPIVFTWGLKHNKSRVYVAFFLLFLVFTFLVKGQSDPAGIVYTRILDLPFGFAFRDSSKFFIPVVLSASMMIGFFVQHVKRNSIAAGLSILILLSVLPAIMGRLQFVLGNQSNVISEVNTTLERAAAGRIAWFPFKPAQGIETQQLQSIDARDLTEFHVFANDNAGSFDHFNYMRNMNYQEWFKLFGIHTVVLAGDTRNINPSTEEQKSWTEFKDYMETSSGLLSELVNNTPIYKLENIKSRILGAEKVVAVVGTDTVASPSVPSVYFEDGVFDARLLDTVSADSVVLYFNNRESQDLQMSLLQNHYKTVFEANNSQWSTWNTNQYLEWKYELLIRGLGVKELDYKKGIAFSTQSNETIEWDFSNLELQEYIFAARVLGNEDSQLIASVNGKEYTITPKETFSWFVQDVGTLSNEQTASLISQSGVSVINTVALIPKKDFVAAVNKANVYEDKFRHITDHEYATLKSSDNWIDVYSNETANLRHSVVAQENVNWVFMSDRYSPLWQLHQSRDYYPSTPLYSYFNGFYLPDGLEDSEIVFTGQKTVRWGLYFSAVSGGFMLAALLYHLANNESKNN